MEPQTPIDEDVEELFSSGDNVSQQEPEPEQPNAPQEPPQQPDAVPPPEEAEEEDASPQPPIEAGIVDDVQPAQTETEPDQVDQPDATSTTEPEPDAAPEPSDAEPQPDATSAVAPDLEPEPQSQSESQPHVQSEPAAAELASELDAGPPQPEPDHALAEAKNELVELEHDDDDDDDEEKHEHEQHTVFDGDEDFEGILAELDLPVVDSLQPDELLLSIKDTITKISQRDAQTEAKHILAYKHSLVQQLERLQHISKAINSLNNMQATAAALPRHALTGYPNTEAINVALREHGFFAEQVSTFGMLLIELVDIKKLRESFAAEYTDSLLVQMMETIEAELVYQHLLFHYSNLRMVVLVYVDNGRELMICGRQILAMLTAHSYEVKDTTMLSRVSIGAALYEKASPQHSVANGGDTHGRGGGGGGHGVGGGDGTGADGDGDSSNSAFDFRTWIKYAELGLNKAKSVGHNRCCMTKEDVGVPAILNDSSSTSSNALHNKHNKSTLSLIARKNRSQSSAGGSTHFNHQQVQQTHLSPQQIRASIRLYDKLMRIGGAGAGGAAGQDKDKPKVRKMLPRNANLIALTTCRTLHEQGASYNFQHPKYDGNTVLMLCCRINLSVIIKYLCVKLPSQVNFNVVNMEGNNALMIAILNQDIDVDIVKMIAKNTKDKMNLNSDGKNAKTLAQEMNRNDPELLELLNID